MLLDVAPGNEYNHGKVLQMKKLHTVLKYWMYCELYRCLFSSVPGQYSSQSGISVYSQGNGWIHLMVFGGMSWSRGQVHWTKTLGPVL